MSHLLATDLASPKIISPVVLGQVFDLASYSVLKNECLVHSLHMRLISPRCGDSAPPGYFSVMFGYQSVDISAHRLKAAGFKACSDDFASGRYLESDESVKSLEGQS